MSQEYKYRPITFFFQEKQETLPEDTNTSLKYFLGQI